MLGMLIIRQKGEEAAPEAATKPAGSVMAALFGQELRNAKGEKVAVDKLDGKLVGIYFAAYRCPPCRVFTPRLVEFHKAVTGAGKPFEIVFVSSDLGEKAMMSYMQYAGMPWLAVPYGSPKVAELKRKFGVRGVPALIIVNAKGETVSTSARNEVGSRGVAAFDAWVK